MCTTLWIATAPTLRGRVFCRNHLRGESLLFRSHRLGVELATLDISFTSFHWPVLHIAVVKDRVAGPKMCVMLQAAA